MANLAGFNAHEVPEFSGGGPLPAGIYTVIASSDEVKENSARTGSYLMFVLDVLTENHTGRKLWVYLNLWHDNETARAASNAELAALCKAVGVPTPQDSKELLNKPFMVEVIVEKDKKTGDDRNRIKTYLPVGTASATTNVAPTTKGAGKASAPWSK